MSTEHTQIQKTETTGDGLSRRKFIGGTAAGAAAVMATGGLALEPLAGAIAEAAPESISAAATPTATSLLLARRKACFNKRRDQAEFWRVQGIVQHPTNGDEARYPNRIGNYSKAMPHNSFAEVEPAAYNSLLTAIASGLPSDYDAMIISPGGAKLGSPQTGLAFDLEGVDCQAVAVPAPPALASKELAGEMIEHYWQALLRDTDFRDYGSSPTAAAACADLNALGADFKGPKIGGLVTPQSLFRDVAPGTTVGPYLSQFMWLNTPFGVEYVERKMWTKAPGDHLQSWTNFLAAQNGFVNESPNFAGFRRYPINGRDLAEWVHIDVLFQAYFNACLIMMTPPDGSDIGGGLGVPFNPGNPYIGNPSQGAFATYGPPAIKAMMCEVASRALKATWHKKWQVHRRLRPENYGGLVEVQVNQSPGRYDGALHSAVFTSSVLDSIESHNGGTLLLPMAHHEGCPTHPSYTAGHATVAGACVTILKAFFDTVGRPIANPKQPSADGLALVPYTGATLTVEGELNKVASNVATGRNIAGVHWRSDAHASLRIGQAVAISILRDFKVMHNEPGASFIFRGFDGESIVV